MTHLIDIVFFLHCRQFLNPFEVCQTIAEYTIFFIHSQCLCGFISQPIGLIQRLGSHLPNAHKASLPGYSYGFFAKLNSQRRLIGEGIAFR